MSSPCCSDWNVPPIDAGESREPGAEREHQQEEQLHADAGRREHVAVVDAGAHQHADFGAVEREPHQDADHDGAEQDDETHQRIRQIDELAAGAHRGDQRHLDRPAEPGRHRHLIEVAAPAPQHQVGEDERDRDRDQRLAQVLPLHPAEDGELQHDAEQRDDHEGGDQREHPASGGVRDLVAEIAAEQIERAVRQIDVAHQPEDQGEAAGDEEIESAERDAVQQCAEENALAAEHLLELGRPDRENQKQQDRDPDHDDE